MRITQNGIFFKPIFPPSKQILNQPKLKTLSKDTVSFGFTRDKKPSKDLQLYRCIGESELNALLKGETIDNGQIYTTSDPRGWFTSNWHNGFNYKKRNTYFITFKTGDENFYIEDRRDNSSDTRYVVRAYNLDNVQNIRKGHNAHGELVWAEDFENAKKLDKENKLREIDRLLNDLRKLSDTKDIDDEKIAEIYDELGYYAKEFPEIIDRLKPLSEHSDKLTILLFKAITDANRPDDWLFVKNKLQNFLNNDVCIDIDFLSGYIGNHATEEDIPMLLDIANSNKLQNNYMGLALSKFEAPEIHSIIKDIYLNGNPLTQHNLLDYFGNKEDIKDIVKYTLEEYKNQQDEMTYRYSCENNSYENFELIQDCIFYLGRIGSKDDIPLLKDYEKNFEDAEYTIIRIKRRENELK